ncbi:UPF0481 protein At3g47200-like [Carex rostrata]
MGEPQIVLDLEASLQLHHLNNANETENQNSSIHEQIFIEEAKIAVDVQASPLSESSPLSKAPIVVDVQASPLSEAPIDADLEASLRCELDTLWGNANEAENFTIFRTPHNISQTKKNLFEPSVISIGPFHHGQKHLRAMEDQKRRFLRDFLSLGDHISLDLCISEMKLLETRTRRCYSETFNDLDSNEFVKMILLDGCFVLEYFIKLSNGDWDSVQEVGWNSSFVDSDLLLLENQIPFFIIEKLYKIGFQQEDNFMNFVTDQLLYMVEERRVLKKSTDYKNPDPPAEIHHLVHLCYHYLVPSPEKPVVSSSKSFNLKGLLHRFCSKVLSGRSPHSTSQSLSVALPNSTVNISSMEILSATPHSTSQSSSVALPNSTGNISSIVIPSATPHSTSRSLSVSSSYSTRHKSSTVIPSATELKQKGLKFKPKSNAKHFLDISFEDGVLKIPSLEITDDTKRIFANLIAFEHSKYGKEHNPFTTYVAFLDNLLNTPNDVTILQECEIIENWLGSEEEVTLFINHVTEYNDFYSDHYLAKLYTEVNRYIGSSLHRQRAKCIRDYFSSPCATISLIAASILLVLTFVQAFIAVFAYFLPP